MRYEVPAQTVAMLTNMGYYPVILNMAFLIFDSLSFDLLLKPVVEQVVRMQQLGFSPHIGTSCAAVWLEKGLSQKENEIANTSLFEYLMTKLEIHATFLTYMDYIILTRKKHSRNKPGSSASHDVFRGDGVRIGSPDSCQSIDKPRILFELNSHFLLELCNP